MVGIPARTGSSSGKRHLRMRLGTPSIRPPLRVTSTRPRQFPAPARRVPTSIVAPQTAWDPVAGRDAQSLIGLVAGRWREPRRRPRAGTWRGLVRGRRTCRCGGWRAARSLRAGIHGEVSIVICWCASVLAFAASANAATIRSRSGPWPRASGHYSCHTAAEGSDILPRSSGCAAGDRPTFSCTGLCAWRRASWNT
jgi:hypothetical protein